MLIGIGGDMAPFDFVFTRSKGHFCKKNNIVWLLKTVDHRAFIFHMLIGLGENTISDVFMFTRSRVKVTWITFVTH